MLYQEEVFIFFGGVFVGRKKNHFYYYLWSSRIYLEINHPGAHGYLRCIYFQFFNLYFFLFFFNFLLKINCIISIISIDGMI